MKSLIFYYLYCIYRYSILILVYSKIFVNIIFKSNIFKLNSKYMKHDKINDIVNPKNSQETSFTNLIIDYKLYVVRLRYPKLSMLYLNINKFKIYFIYSHIFQSRFFNSKNQPIINYL